MGKHGNADTYPLDHGGLVHIPSVKKGFFPGFRIEVTLREPVRPEVLQQAVDRVVRRFPTIAAGIRPGLFSLFCYPVEVPPRVRRDERNLAPMSREEFRTCGIRFLYRENQIICEFNHVMTDGYSGFVIICTLVAEYLRLIHGVTIPASRLTRVVDEPVPAEELADDFITYAAKRKQKYPPQNSTCLLPGRYDASFPTVVTSRSWKVEDVLRAAHGYHVSLTAFLTAVMVSSLIEIQNSRQGSRRGRRIRLLVPIDLRNLFPSKTLRNFILQASPCVEPEDFGLPFDRLAENIGAQMAQQITPENTAGLMALVTGATRFPLYRILPWPLKQTVLKGLDLLFGERCTTLSMSNLGNLQLPEAMRPYVKQLDGNATPRFRSPYNCSIYTFDGVVTVNIARGCPDSTVEDVFFRKLEQLLGPGETARQTSQRSSAPSIHPEKGEA